MTGVYAYSENDRIIIGNDYIERRFISAENKLRPEEIINKRIDGGLSLKLSSFSAEFFIGFKSSSKFHAKTEFLSSNELTVDNINILKNRAEFIFKPYSFHGTKITFILNIEVSDSSPYMSKYIEMIVDEENQKNITVDYIDCEHICVGNCKNKWSIGEIDKAYLSSYHSALGQPIYLNGTFFTSTFPLAEANISDSTAYIRYFSGKRFDEMNLSCGTTYRTWNTVSGAAPSTDYGTVRREFLNYIRSISRDIKPRIQYNSWYDHMLEIDESKISKSFSEIEDGLSKSLTEPIDSYVVDDGFSDYGKDFWNFNSKFPNGFSEVSSLAEKLSSNFGMWLGPRGGYNSETKAFAKRMEKSGKGGFNRASGDVCVADKTYIKNLTEYFIEKTDLYNINYWKLDGFLLKACHSKNHGHITGGYNNMYEYTEMWERWIDLFRKLRIHRETKGGDIWINQTSYSNASPLFLQWSDSLWLQNSNDMGKLKKTDKGEKLSSSDVDLLLSYRDGRYYDFFVNRKYQFPPEYIYSHDPIYGNAANISMTDGEFRKYLFMIAARGNYLWELYYSYNMMSPAKWRINADVFRFVKNNADVLKNAVFVGRSPEKGEIYGFSAWTENEGIVSLRNPSDKTKEFSFALNKIMGCSKFAGKMKRADVYPYTNTSDKEAYSYGDSFTVKLQPSEAVLMKFTSAKEKTPNLIYGRFNSEKELLLYFDDRIYFKPNMISSDKEISSLELLEDYSTLKITFSEKTDKAYVSLTVMNMFGDMTDAELNAQNYPDFVCTDGKIPNGRDFTVSFRVNSTENSNILQADDLSLKIFDSGLSLTFCGEHSAFDCEIKSGDRITLVCEPNALLKVYQNTDLIGSIFNKSYINSLVGKALEFSENSKDIKIISKAIKYSETE